MNFERYESRDQAGRRLSSFLQDSHNDLFISIIRNSQNFFCFAIPNGGVPVAEGFCKETNLKYELLIVRKIKIPYNPEAGFGSVTPDGTVLLNKQLLANLSLSQKEIDASIDTTKHEIRERLEFYGKKKEHMEDYSEKINNKTIFLIDDGLASGFTMMAAVKMVKQYNPQKIYILVPTAPYRTVQRVERKADEVICPNIRKVMRFAVANAYKHWYDLSASEVLEILSNSDYYEY